jgi:hypothetical protein
LRLSKVEGPIFNFFLAGILSSCGIFSGIDETKKAVELTNQTSDGILEQIKLTNLLMEALRKELGTTGEAIHLQALSTALGGLLAPANTEHLTPPARMMPFALAYAEEATEDELIRTVHVLLTEAKYGPPEAIANRRIALTALSAISAFATRESAQNILSVQVDGRGLYQETAYVFAVGRFSFICDFLLSPMLDNSTVFNKAMLEDAFEHYQSLKFLADLPYRPFLVLDLPSLSVSMSVESAEVARLGRKTRRKFSENLLPEELSDPNVVRILSELPEPAE